jgi:hypothetical protein
MARSNKDTVEVEVLVVIASFLPNKATAAVLLLLLEAADDDIDDAAADAAAASRLRASMRLCEFVDGGGDATDVDAAAEEAFEARADEMSLANNSMFEPANDLVAFADRPLWTVVVVAAVRPIPVPSMPMMLLLNGSFGPTAATPLDWSLVIVVDANDVVVDDDVRVFLLVMA